MAEAGSTHVVMGDMAAASPLSTSVLASPLQSDPPNLCHPDTDIDTVVAHDAESEMRDTLERNASAALATFQLHMASPRRRSFDATTTITPRPASCMRPPCLKRSQYGSEESSSHCSVASNSASLHIPTASSTRGQGGSSQPNAPLATPTYSFSAPRCILFGKARRDANRRVHFDSSPPTSLDTFSAEDYDRSQIECTQGGSDMDLRLPSKCKRYNSDGEEDDEDDYALSEAEDDASSSTSSASCSRSPPFGSSGSTGWACLRKGSVIGALHSPRPPACRPASSDADRNVSLPVHGVRSFGGLAQSTDATANQAQMSREGLSTGSNRTHHDDLGDDEEEEDILLEHDEDAAVEAAVIASLPTKSPNATPKPSPSIIPRWARCTDYFEGAVQPRSPLSASAVNPESASVIAPSPMVSPSESRSSRDSDGNIPLRSNTMTTCSSHDSLRTLHASSAGPATPLEAEPVIASDADTDAVASMPNASPPKVAPEMQLSSSTDNNASASRRPALSKTSAFIGGPLCGDVASPMYLSPASSSGDVAASVQHANSDEDQPALPGASGPNSSQEHLRAVSTPSPLSSRCSSVDPWAALSSSGDEDGTTGTSSPYAEWSSCTSPDLMPSVTDLVSPAETLVKSTSTSSVVALPPAAGNNPTLALDATPKQRVVSATTEVLNGARCFLEAERREHSRSRSPNKGKGELRCEGSSTSSPPSTDEEVGSPRRRSSNRPSGSRRSSSSSNTRNAGGGGSASSSLSPSRTSSSRSSSLCMSMVASGEGEDGDDEVSPSPRRSKSASSSSSRSNSASGGSGKVKRMPVWRRDSFEDEGALGGF